MLCHGVNRMNRTILVYASVLLLLGCTIGTIGCSGDTNPCATRPCIWEPDPHAEGFQKETVLEVNREPSYDSSQEGSSQDESSQGPESTKEKLVETVSESSLGEEASEDAGSEAEQQMEKELPCGGIACPAHSFCEPKSNQCACEAGYSFNSKKDACLKNVAPQGWIGLACQASKDCSYSNGFCLASGQGYPGGHCSLRCTRLCPDKSGKAITFCIQPQGLSQGHCFSRCDTKLYPTNNGCRSGYDCRAWPRYGEPQTVKNVCVPKDWTSSVTCSDPTNFAQDDSCYLSQVSYGDTVQKSRIKRLLEGTASTKDATDFLDTNFQQSQVFVKNELGVKTIQPNYSKGHRSSRPMVGLILHYTAAQAEDGTVRYFSGSAAHASTHFIVGSRRNGLVIQLFSHKNRTWHAGSTYNIDRFGFDFANAGYLKQKSGVWKDYANRTYKLKLPMYGTDPVKVTGGIPGASSKYGRLTYWQPYTYYQLLSYVLVARALHKVYTLKPSKIQRHGDVSGSRVDPGPHLPTNYLNKLVFNNNNVFQETWLQQYKVQKDWIEKNPNAR